MISTCSPPFVCCRFQSNIIGFGFGGSGFCPAGVGGCTSAGCRNAPWENSNWGREVGDGGGLAGIFFGKGDGVAKSNAIAIAGGGGGGSDSSNGGGALNPGDSWNTASAAMKGQRGSVRGGGGGGGYTGGRSGNGQRSVSGGTNYVGGFTKSIASKAGVGSDHAPNPRPTSGGAEDDDWESRVGLGGNVRTDCNGANSNALHMGGPALVKIWYVDKPPPPPPPGHNFTYVLEQLQDIQDVMEKQGA